MRIEPFPIPKQEYKHNAKDERCVKCYRIKKVTISRYHTHTNGSTCGGLSNDRFADFFLALKIKLPDIE